MKDFLLDLNWGLLGPIVALFLIVGGWFAVCWVAAQLSGWNKLAKHYREERPFSGKVIRHSGFIGLSHYGGRSFAPPLTLGIESYGLHLSAGLFHHPPLLIPWEEIAAGEITTGPRRIVNVLMRFKKVPSVCLKINLMATLKLGKEVDDSQKDLLKKNMGTMSEFFFVKDSSGSLFLKCPKCGEVIEGNIRFCPKCGNHLNVSDRV